MLLNKNYSSPLISDENELSGTLDTLINASCMEWSEISSVLMKTVELVSEMMDQ